MLINNFIPSDGVVTLEGRAKWDEESDDWILPRLEMSGNAIRPKRPISNTNLKRPETEYGRNRKKYDNNPRYMAENIVQMELDMADRTTEDYDGTSMSGRVQAALGAAMDGDPADLTNGQINPYLNYGNTTNDVPVSLNVEYERNGRGSKSRKSRR